MYRKISMVKCDLNKITTILWSQHKKINHLCIVYICTLYIRMLKCKIPWVLSLESSDLVILSCLQSSELISWSFVEYVHKVLRKTNDSNLPKKKIICFNDSPSKMIKNAFYFLLKLFLFSRYLIFFLTFWACRKKRFD